MTQPTDIITAAKALIAATTAVGQAQADLMVAQTAQREASDAFVAVRSGDLPTTLSGSDASDIIRAIGMIVPSAITMMAPPVIGGGQ